jgi:hypothetical protein
LNFSLEKVVDHDVVGRAVEFVANVDNFKLTLHAFFAVQQVHCPENSDET